MKASKRKFRTLLFLFYQIATEIFVRRRRRAFFIFSKERKAGAYVEKLNKVVVRLYQDVVFRCVFGREGMEVYLIGLLNAIFLQFGFPPIKKLTIKNPYQFPSNEEQKTSILDVYVKDENGRRIDVEMQTHNQASFNKRVIYYAAQNYVAQSRKGEKYGRLRPSFVVAFVRFPIPDRPDDCWIDVQQMHSRQYSNLWYDDLTVIYVRIPDKPGMRIPKNLSRSLRDWIRYIGSDVTPKQVVGRIKARDETINKLDEVIERFAMSEEGQTMITREERYAIDREEQNRFIAKNARKEGLKKGRAEGKAEAIENYLSVRFPDDFAERFQLWRPKLYKKSLPALNSLLTTSASCSSLDEFTQNL